MNDKQKIILAGAVCVLLVAGVATLHYFKLRERSDLLKQIESYGKQAQDAQAKIARIPELRKERENMANIINEYMQILPKEEHVQHDAFVDIIDGYRKDTQIVIQKAEYVPIKEKQVKKKGGKPEPEKNKDFLRHRYRFKLFGTVPELVEFINKIENHTRFLKIDALSIKPLGAAEETGDGSGDTKDEEEIARAAEPIKEIELTVSTYTYFKGSEKKM
jgi:hypothetical protein